MTNYCTTRDIDNHDDHLLAHPGEINERQRQLREAVTTSINFMEIILNSSEYQITQINTRYSKITSFILSHIDDIGNPLQTPYTTPSPPDPNNVEPIPPFPVPPLTSKET